MAKYICVIETNKNYDKDELDKVLSEELKYLLIGDKINFRIIEKRY